VVDHDTAFDLADATNMIEAIKVAAFMSGALD
jgi:hypothetical protein